MANKQFSYSVIWTQPYASWAPTSITPEEQLELQLVSSDLEEAKNVIDYIKSL